MTRSTTNNQDVALAASHVSGLILVELDFALPLYICNLGYNFQWNGILWQGVGTLGSVDPISEGSQLLADGVKMTIGGVPTDLISTALGEQYQGKRVQIWFCPLDDNAQPIDVPIRIFFGRIDTMDIEAGATSTITLTGESRLVDWARPRVSRYNHQDQQAKYPTDMGFQYVADVVDTTIVWGRA